MGEEVDDTGTVTGRDATDTAHIVRGFPDAVCPYIAVCIGILFCLHGFLKPFAGNSGMAGNQIQDYMHITLMSLGEQICQIFIGTITGCYGIIILYIITSIAKRGLEAGIQPDGSTSKFFDIIQLTDDTVDITDTIGIGIAERLGIDFIKNSIVKPCGLFYSCAHERFLLKNNVSVFVENVFRPNWKKKLFLFPYNDTILLEKESFN